MFETAEWDLCLVDYVGRDATSVYERFSVLSVPSDLMFKGKEFLIFWNFIFKRTIIFSLENVLQEAVTESFPLWPSFNDCVIFICSTPYAPKQSPDCMEDFDYLLYYTVKNMREEMSFIFSKFGILSVKK